MKKQEIINAIKEKVKELNIPKCDISKSIFFDPVNFPRILRGDGVVSDIGLINIMSFLDMDITKFYTDIEIKVLIPKIYDKILKTEQKLNLLNKSLNTLKNDK